MKKKKGVSIIELLIALAILATGFLMILGVFPVSMKSVKQGKDVLFAAHLAQYQMEKAIYQNFTDSNLSIPATGMPSPTATMTSIVNNVTTMTEFTYSVSFNPDDGTGSIKQIIVTAYPTNQIPGRIVKFETYVAREY